MKVQNTIHHCQCDACQAGTDPDLVQHHGQINLLLSRLNEPQRRWFVGLLSQKPESPSDRQLSCITGLDEKTIRRGRNELQEGFTDLPPQRQRREGAGRPTTQKKTQS